MIRVFIQYPIPGVNPNANTPYIVASAKGDDLPSNTSADVLIDTLGVVSVRTCASESWKLEGDSPLLTYTGYLWVISNGNQYGLTLDHGVLQTVMLVSGDYLTRQEFLFVGKSHCGIWRFGEKLQKCIALSKQGKYKLSRYQRIKRFKRVVHTHHFARAMDRIIGWDYTSPTAIPAADFFKGINPCN